MGDPFKMADFWGVNNLKFLNCFVYKYFLKGWVVKLEHSAEHRREEKSLPKDPTGPQRLPKERRAGLPICPEINQVTFAFFNLFSLTLGVHSRDLTISDNNNSS